VDTESTVTLTAAVTVKVQAEAQLFIAEESDPDSLAALIPGLKQRRTLLNSGVTGRRLPSLRRDAQIDGIFTRPEVAAFINSCISDAKTIVSAFLSAFGSMTADQVPDDIG